MRLRVNSFVSVIRCARRLRSAALLTAVGRQVRDDSGKLAEHLPPAELGTPKRLFAPRLGDRDFAVLDARGQSRPGDLSGRMENAR